MRSMTDISASLFLEAQSRSDCRTLARRRVPRPVGRGWSQSSADWCPGHQTPDGQSGIIPDPSSWPIGELPNPPQLGPGIVEGQFHCLLRVGYVAVQAGIPRRPDHVAYGMAPAPADQSAPDTHPRAASALSAGRTGWSARTGTLCHGPGGWHGGSGGGNRRVGNP